MNVDLTIVFLGLLVFFAHLFAAIYNRRKIPDVLLLLLIGIILGPLTGLISPEDLGQGGPIFAAVTLVVILFEGGTSLNINTLKSSWKSTVNLTLSCFLFSVILVALIGVLLLNMPIIQSVILGATLGGTSSAVVIPLIRQLKMGEDSKTVLVLESAATDVLCIVVVLALLETFAMGSLNVGVMIGNVLSSFVLAGFIGFVGALIWSRLITKMRKLQNSIFTTPAFVFLIYGLAQLLGYSGAIAALVFGISMANVETFKGVFLRKIMGGSGHKLNNTELVFFGEIVFLLKTAFFVMIGISIIFNDWTSILVGLLISVVLLIGRLFMARYVSPKSADVFDKSIISMMIPKGLAAAVLAAFPEQMGVPYGEVIKNLTYSVIFFSILLVSILILLYDNSSRIRTFYAAFYGNDKNKEGIKNRKISIFAEKNASVQEDSIPVLSRPDTSFAANLPACPKEQQIKTENSSAKERMPDFENTLSDNLKAPEED